MKTKAILYLRASKEEQLIMGCSLKEQARQLKKHCKNNSIGIVKISIEGTGD